MLRGTQQFCELMTKNEMRKDFLVSVGSTIKNKREQKNITQEQLAVYLEVTKSTVSRYEKGAMDMPVSNLPLISHYCNFPISDFVRAERVKTAVSQLDYLVGVYTGDKGMLDRAVDEGLKNARQELEQDLLREGNEPVMDYINASKDVVESMEQLEYGCRECDILAGTLLISLVKRNKGGSEYLKHYVEALTGRKWEEMECKKG